MRTYYFGTDLTNAGHYFFELVQSFNSTNTRYGDTPFNPERLPISGTGNYSIAPKGMTRFYNLGPYSICAIGGSPKDQRPGCKSVFYWVEELTKEQMIDIIKSHPLAMRIINQMPFPVEVFKEKKVIT